MLEHIEKLHAELVTLRERIQTAQIEFAGNHDAKFQVELGSAVLAWRNCVEHVIAIRRLAIDHEHHG